MVNYKSIGKGMGTIALAGALTVGGFAAYDYIKRVSGAECATVATTKTIKDKKTGIEFNVDYCAETAKVKDIKVNKLKGHYANPDEIRDLINNRVEELRNQGFK